jgi:hypothetical protein
VCLLLKKMKLVKDLERVSPDWCRLLISNF